jgi:hypothetical protein
MGETKNEQHSGDRRSLAASALETTTPAHLNTQNLKMNRVNEYAAPMHNARMTKVYSVSFPVCIV